MADNNKSDQPDPPDQPPQQPQKRERAHFLREFLQTTFGKVLAVIGALLFVWSLYKTVGEVQIEYSYLYPEISFGDQSSILPFLIENKSRFSMYDVTLVCVIESAFFETDDLKPGPGFSIPVTSGVTNTEIEPKSSVHYPCSASDFMHLDANGTLSLLGLQATMPSLANHSIHVARQVIRINIRYRVLKMNTEEMSSQFTWMPTPAGPKWFKGEIFR